MKHKYLITAMSNQTKEIKVFDVELDEPIRNMSDLKAAVQKADKWLIVKHMQPIAFSKYE